MATVLADSQRFATSSLLSVIQVPNSLSLDAPVVAVSWQCLLSATFIYTGSGHRFSLRSAPSLLPAMIVLFITVWIIYMADRLLDCRRLDFNRVVPLRHRFVNRWSMLLWPIWVVMLVVGGFVATVSLDGLMLTAGGILLGIVLAYCWAVHCCDEIRTWLPKELFVGTIFAIGVSLPTARFVISPPLLCSTCLLTALFVLNCLCVASAQRRSDQQQQIGSAVLYFPRLASQLPFLAALVTLTAATLGWVSIVPLTISVAATVSGIGLMLLAWIMQRDVDWISHSRCGQLADYALLSPLFVLATIG